MNDKMNELWTAVGDAVKRGENTFILNGKLYEFTGTYKQKSESECPYDLEILVEELGVIQ